jgi:hypothetical protein
MTSPRLRTHLQREESEVLNWRRRADLTRSYAKIRSVTPFSQISDSPRFD